MNNNTPIGRVIATEREPTTTGSVRFWLQSDVELKPFDFVRLTAPETTRRDIGDFYAIIHEIKQVSDEPSPLTGFISADFGQADVEPSMSRIITTYAEAAVLFNTKDIEMPVPHGAQVRWPDEEGVRRALGIQDYNRPIPCGYITMSGPNNQPLTIHVDMDIDYLAGPEGAHLNISGISGLATKTSYGMFLLTAIQQKQERDHRNSGQEQAAFVILNVKGADLLGLHEADSDLSQETIDDWKKCGLDATPLKHVTYFYPCGRGEGGVQSKLAADEIEKNVQDGIAFRYHYDVEATIDSLGLLVEDQDDPNQTLVSCADYCRDNIPRRSSWTAFRRNVGQWSDKTPESKIMVQSWRRFYRLFGQRTKNPLFTEATAAGKKHEVPLRQILDHLSPGHVVVVDIAQLPDYLQSFIVGDVINILREAKVDRAELEDDEDLERGEALGTVILFADELNKFAPRYGQARSITRHLREVSERGRSEGIILFGAEQFRTGVDERVTGNSGTQVFGRTTAVEATRDQEIRSLPGAQSGRVAFLRKGELMVSHTRFSSGTLKLRFPRNAYRPR